MTEPSRWLVLLVAACFGLACWYNLTTPLLESPDEVWHYAYVRELVSQHTLPVVDAEGKTPYRQEGLQPPLYYALGAPIIAWLNPRALEDIPQPNPFAQIGIPRADTNDNRNAFLHADDGSLRDTSLAVHLLRLYSTLLGAGTVILTFLLASEFAPLLFRESGTLKALPILSAALVAFLPQFLSLNSSIGNDSLAILLSVATLWQVALAVRTGVDLKRAGLLGLLVGAALLAKLNTISLAPLVLLAFAYVAYERKQWRQMLASAALFGATVVLVAGWWYWRNLQLYGDITTLSRFAGLIGERPTPPDFIRWLLGEGEGLRLSLWGVFGWFTILMPRALYAFYDALALLGLLGIAVAVARTRPRDMRLLLLPLWCAVIFLALWRYALILPASQGRLLFPALPAWAVLWGWGILSLLPTFSRVAVTGAICLSFLVAAAIVPARVIGPAYAPNIIARDFVTVDVPARDWRFSNGIKWAGAQLYEDRVRAGEPVHFTVYTIVPPGGIPREAIFIHLVNSANVIVAQRDSFIGSGNVPAAPDSRVVVDNFLVSTPVTSPAPDVWRVEVGMYDPSTGQRVRAHDSSGQSLGDVLQLTTLNAELPAPNAFHFDFEGRATLIGTKLNQDSVAQGETFKLVLNWESIVRDGEAYHVFVHALDSEEHIWSEAEARLVPERSMQMELPFDKATPPGVYRLELGVYQPPDGDRLAVYDAQGQLIGDRMFLGPIRVASK